MAKGIGLMHEKRKKGQAWNESPARGALSQGGARGGGLCVGTGCFGAGIRFFFFFFFFFLAF